MRGVGGVRYVVQSPKKIWPLPFLVRLLNPLYDEVTWRIWVGHNQWIRCPRKHLPWVWVSLRHSHGNSIVYRNSKLWKIIIWLLCIINCFCLWYSIIWWYCIIFIWKKLWLSIIWFYDDFPSYYDFIWWLCIIKNDVLAPQRACRPVRVQTGGCAEFIRNFYNLLWVSIKGCKFHNDGNSSYDGNQKVLQI